MHIVISPAKSINFDIENRSLKTTKIRFEKYSKKLLSVLKQYSTNDLSALMKVSTKLAQLNFERFQLMQFPFDIESTKPSILVFKGDVFQGMNIDAFSDDDLIYTQYHLSILSGFYGILRPLDGIMPYRLEMGTALVVGEYKNLYHFWGDKIKKILLQDMAAANDTILVNLASNEYYKSLRTNGMKCRIITPVFKDYKNGNYKIISFYAKKARGMMAAYILKNRIENPEEMKLFNDGGYMYNDQLSKGDNWVFTRG